MAGVEGSDPRLGLPRDVWVMNSDGTNPRRLAPGDDPAWSPDSSIVLYPAVFTRDGRIGVGVIAPRYAIADSAMLKEAGAKLTAFHEAQKGAGPGRGPVQARARRFGGPNLIAADS